MAKIYVASSWRNTYQESVVNQLRNAGHDVYDFKNPPSRSDFSWSDVDPNWQNWSTDTYRRALTHPISEAGFESDFWGMDEAEVCVLVLPCGRSAHTEAGFMKGQGKFTCVYIPEPMEPELMYKCFNLVTDNLSELLEAIDNGIWHFQDMTEQGWRFNNFTRQEYCFIPDHMASHAEEARRILFDLFDQVERFSLDFQSNWNGWKAEFIGAMRDDGFKQSHIDQVDFEYLKVHYFNEGHGAYETAFNTQRE